MKHNFLFLAVLLSTLFAMHAVAQNAGYILYGNGPEGYTDLTDQVSVTAMGSAAFEDGVFTGAGLPGRICESSNYLQLSFVSAQTMNLTDQFALHVVLQKDDAATGKVQVSFCKNGWNAARVSWEIVNASIASADASDIALKYEERKTDNWNSYLENSFIGEVQYPAAEIMRICAASGESFTISGIYLDASFEGGEIIPDDPVVIPEQDPQRIYIRKGSAVTPDGVLETADYSSGAYITSEWWNCTPATEFFGITTNAEWWFNFQLRNNADVDLTPVYSTWQLVIGLQNDVVEEGQDRGLTIELGEPAANLLFASTYEEAGAIIKKVLPLTQSLTRDNHLTNISAGIPVMVMSSGNNAQAGRNIVFDYIYFTNESASDDATGVSEVSSKINATKILRNGQLFILRNNIVYDINGKQVQ